MKTHHEKKRAEWKEKREERKENVGALKEKISERMGGKPSPVTDSPKH